MKWRHKKRGSTYDEIGTARLQVSDPGALRDMEEMIVYRGSDGAMWVRPALEFHDGRFEVVAETR